MELDGALRVSSSRVRFVSGPAVHTAIHTTVHTAILQGYTQDRRNTLQQNAHQKSALEQIPTLHLSSFILLDLFQPTSNMQKCVNDTGAGREMTVQGTASTAGSCSAKYKLADNIIKGTVR